MKRLLRPRPLITIDHAPAPAESKCLLFRLAAPAIPEAQFRGLSENLTKFWNNSDSPYEPATKADL